MTENELKLVHMVALDDQRRATNCDLVKKMGCGDAVAWGLMLAHVSQGSMPETMLESFSPRAIAYWASQGLFAALIDVVNERHSTTLLEGEPDA